MNERRISFALVVPSSHPVAAHKCFQRWECPNCGQHLGEVMGERLVIAVKERRLSIPIREGTEQTCWRCGSVSEMRLLQ